MSLSIAPAKPKTEKAFSQALLRFSKEDPSFTYRFDEEGQEFIISGMGELHLEIYCQVRDTLRNLQKVQKYFTLKLGSFHDCNKYSYLRQIVTVFGDSL